MLKSYGWTYQRLSAELGKVGRPLNPESVARMVKGERRVDLDDFVAVCTVFNLPLDALVNYRVRTTREIHLEETGEDLGPAMTHRYPAAAETFRWVDGE